MLYFASRDQLWKTANWQVDATLVLWFLSSLYNVCVPVSLSVFALSALFSFSGLSLFLISPPDVVLTPLDFMVLRDIYTLGFCLVHSNQSIVKTEDVGSSDERSFNYCQYYYNILLQI